LKVSAPILHEVPPEAAMVSNECVGDIGQDGDDNLLKVQPGSQPVCQIMSDLHLEWRGYEQFHIVREAPNLLLVGDIGRFCDYDRFLGFLRRQCETFDRVLLVPGNHEFYGSSRQEGLEIGKKFECELGEKFKFMHRRRVALEDGKTIILGCTLHSHIPENYTALTNDFNRIDGWKVRFHNEEHIADREWLEQSLAETTSSNPGSRIIAATHYAPAFEKTVQPAHEGSDLRHCFSSNTLEALSTSPGIEQLSHWVFGHTHYNNGFRFNGVIVVSNQPTDPRPCASNGRQFDPKLVI
jgi:predicted phosphodiesterase